MIVYADDADFICTDPSVVQLIQAQAPAILSRWSLHMNEAKTEVTEIRRHCNPSGATRHARAREETWRHTKKLGTLLGDIEDLSRRKSLATLTLHRLWSAWLRPTLISSKTRIRLDNTYVLPILLYNCATWALTKSELHGLEIFHRRQLRYALGYRYPRHISNARLYDLCDERPLRLRLTQARWRLFGHVLRRNPDIPANLPMRAYFSSTAANLRGRPRTTLPSTLDHDLVSCGSGFRLRTAQDLEALRTLAQDRKKWNALMTSVLDALLAERDPTNADTTLCRAKQLRREVHLEVDEAVHPRPYRRHVRVLELEHSQRRTHARDVAWQLLDVRHAQQHGV